MSAAVENEHKIIDYCFFCKELSSLKCSNCVKIFYCSPEHQRYDWKRHKRECHPFEVGNVFSDIVCTYTVILYTAHVKLCERNKKKIISNQTSCKIL